MAINKSFPKPLIVKYLDGRLWELMKPFEYHPKKGKVIRVPERFRFDFASIPKIFYSFIGPPTGKYGPAALCHDWLYSTQTTKRSYADKIFLEAMKVLKVNWIKRRLMWLAVRVGGFAPWKRHAKRLKKGELR